MHLNNEFAGAKVQRPSVDIDLLDPMCFLVVCVLASISVRVDLYTCRGVFVRMYVCVTYDVCLYFGAQSSEPQAPLRKLFFRRGEH